MRTLIVSAAVLVALAAEAGVYKCVVDGKTAFSQIPCGETAEEVELRYHTPEPPPAESGGAPAIPAADPMPEANKADLVILDRRIRAKEDEIKKYQRYRDADMERLRRRKGYANNNLAGATWEQSISTEMVAVAEKYKAMIDVAQTELKALQGQRQGLGSDQ